MGSGEEHTPICRYRSASTVSQQRVNEPAEQFADALMQSYKAVADSGVSAQERSTQVTEVFFNHTINNLREQAEENRQATQQLAEQALARGKRVKPEVFSA